MDWQSIWKLKMKIVTCKTALMQLMLLPLVILVGCNTKTTINMTTAEVDTTSASEKSCIVPTETFAYPVVTGPLDRQSVLPPFPWQIKAQMPSSLLENGRVALLATRKTIRNTEIWFSFNKYNPYSPSTNKIPQFVIYRSNDSSWKYTSAEIGDTGVFAYNLFVDNDGVVWAQNVRDIKSSAKDTHFFSRYNDETESFEVVNGTDEIPVLSKMPKLFPGVNKTLLDDDGVFWIFAHYDAIYSYDTKTEEIRKHLEIPSLAVADVAPTPDGNFYISGVVSDPVNITDQLLYKFLPAESSLQQVSIRLEPWPLYTNIMIDHNDRLWLGSLGWLEPDGVTWYQIHRSPVFITNILWSGKESRWKSGSLELASSDGRMWFYSDNGMISLDPDKGEWCWFTTYQSNIVEDSEHNLWMIADGKLYKLALEK